MPLCSYLSIVELTLGVFSQSSILKFRSNVQIVKLIWVLVSLVFQIPLTIDVRFRCCFGGCLWCKGVRHLRAACCLSAVLTSSDASLTVSASMGFCFNWAPRSKVVLASLLTSLGQPPEREAIASSACSVNIFVVAPASLRWWSMYRNTSSFSMGSVL